MDENLPAIRRLCLAYVVDLPDENEGTERAEAAQQSNLAFAQVCASLGLDRILLARRGTGQLGLFPVGIDEPEVISSLVTGLFQALAGLDVRFRIAFHEGVTTLLTAGGYGGKAVAKVGRLAESGLLQAALARHRRASLAVLLSAPVFEDIDRHLPIDQFQPVEIDEPGRRGSPDVAWIFVPQREICASDPSPQLAMASLAGAVPADVPAAESSEASLRHTHPGTTATSGDTQRP